ncbi:MAG: hypothetical protein LBV26_09400 [Bacteroidales bacterium]|jgi:hypothetical protein|nr:hypothetical protein [Bacteroidales bacterium]
MTSLEQKTAGTILQQPVEVEIGTKKYSVAPPSVATLILASAAVSKLPAVNLSSNSIATECLYIAKDCEALGEIAAILILGAKGLKRTEAGVIKSFFRPGADRKTALANEILAELSPRQLSDLVGKLLSGMELAFFFATTTSLTEINLLRKTRMAETTASGQ